MLIWALPAMGVAQMFQCAGAPPGPHTQAWTESNRCLPIVIDDGLSALSDDGGERVQQAYQAWSDPCTDVSFIFRTASELGLPTGVDLVEANEAGGNYNVITAADTEEELARIEELRGLVAVTLALYIRQTAEIVDADVILNFQRFDFSTDAASCSDAFDLAGTITHEAGHVLGFGHTLDVDATMYGDALTCETHKRDLNETDREGLCSVYPAGGPTRTCEPPASYDLEGRDLSAFRAQCEQIDDACRCAHVDPGADRVPAEGLLGVLAWAWLGSRRTVRGSRRRDSSARFR